MRVALPLCALALGACVASEGDEGKPANDPEYLGIETRLLEGDLVSFLVKMKHPESPESIDEYAKCAAAQYALIRGYGFARHVRTNLSDQAGVFSADAVYTISAALPRGLKTLDAEVTVQNCTELGIPTV